MGHAGGLAKLKVMKVGFRARVGPPRSTGTLDQGSTASMVKFCAAGRRNKLGGIHSDAPVLGYGYNQVHNGETEQYTVPIALRCYGLRRVGSHLRQAGS